MALYYPEEHTTCYNYNSSDSTFERKVFKKGDRYSGSSVYTHLIVVLKGEFVFSFGTWEKQVIRGGWITVIPSGYHLNGEVLEETEVLVVRIKREVALCERFSLQKLTEGRDLQHFPSNLAFLPINERMESFIRAMLTYLEDGLKCYYFFDAKLTELFFNFRAYYSKDELFFFFRLMLHEDSKFANFVIAKSPYVKSVKELARMANYSPSGFDKKFRKVFRVSAHQWLKQEQARHIFHEIHSDKPLKQISVDYGFSSPSRFNDFCKEHFGAPPGRLRKCGWQ
jgi:AraC-like DNA-binding protein